ncbi:lysozyme [Glaesserella parasuis]|uniref:lysozyme n=1 Tax=Glaesserella parasuis TaxID=738 RepID=UPI0021BDB48F|nr:lysozyme [Glaesserella parasuis]MCT8830279.1 lysozyme [Glaesserella parasuis]MCT8834554.1 lysozyme [Glaesserella parasuis]MDG6450313.1 lysozyme [Glaesserella parasuis]MDO9656539.1 lysozyme [Glaesserella parasuis]MDO9716253.1 lysozyme [Glaesserella parasuis]
MKKLKQTLIYCSVAVIAGLTGKLYPELQASRAGIELTANKEACVRNPYQCAADVWTVGIGSTAAGGEKIEQGKIYNDVEIATRFAHDLKIAEKCVTQHFNGAKMQQRQFDAMVSLVFNVGCVGAKSYYNAKTQKREPTTLYKLAQAEQFNAMCNRITDFNRAGGKVLKGLQLRREAERKHCLGIMT